jgi:predicted O-methyltransferase YrrM
VWTIEECFRELLAIRYQLGALHGSEEICVLLYSLIKREKPKVIVELGTGMGVSTAWMAAAMKENGFGRILTYDNGSHFDKPKVKEFLGQMHGSLQPIAETGATGDFEEFLTKLFKSVGVSEHVHFFKGDLDLNDVANIAQALNGQKIDMLFSDYSHSAEMVQTIVGTFLPMMANTSSIFIDSASTHVPSFLTLERLVELLNHGKIPQRMSLRQSDVQREATKSLMEHSSFKVMHLIENLDRPQNSTAWIRIEPYDMVPPVTEFFH